MKINRDNWGSRARFGLFIVGSEAVPEAEWWAMVPDDISVHAARVAAAAPWGRWSDDRADVDLVDDLAHGLRQLASMRLTAVVIAHSSSSFIGGKGWDEVVIKKLSAQLAPTVSVTTNGLDMLAALTAQRVTRPFLVMPAWFDDAAVRAGLDYFHAHEVEPAGHLRADPGPAWRHVPPRQMYPKGLGFEQVLDTLYAQILASCPDDADGVLIVGTGVRCVAILDGLEQQLGRPVISANQASLWRCLGFAGIAGGVGGYGSLLAP